MPTYRIGGQMVRRKNFYLPCAIAARTEDMSDEEHARVLKAAYWADNITNAEWPVVLGHEDCSPSAKSRLKKKAAGWLVALGRIAVLNPELFEQIGKQAVEVYAEQTETDYPGSQVALAVWPWLADLVQQHQSEGGES